MHTRLITMVAGLLLAPALAFAQQSEGFTPAGRQVDIGVRGTAYGSGSDEARYQRYRDLRDGVTLDFFRYLEEGDGWQLNATADHVGYRDQRATARFNRYGKVKASFEWDQLPLYYSGTTRTLFTEVSPGVFALDDAVQGNARALPAAIAGGAAAFDLRQKRHTADANIVFSASRNADVTFSLRNTQKSGQQPYAGTFGIGGTVVSEFPMTLDQRTTELSGAFAWANSRAFARVGYDGSFFRNDQTTLVWDNPLRTTDAINGSALGRMALAPSSDLNTLSASGTIKLPGRSRAAAHIAYGLMSQDEALLPFSINTTHAVALPRDRANVEARTTAMNYSFTSAPVRMLWFNARYRQYEFDNQTPEFTITEWVNWDSAIATGEHTIEAFNYTRRTFDGDALFSPSRFVGLKFGYTREDVDRHHRVTAETIEDVVRLSADSTGLGWLTIRGIYEHSERRGSGVDRHMYFEINEQPALRQFDISDRDRDRVSAIVVVTPVSTVSFNGSIGMGNEDYPDAYFGLRDNDHVVYTVGADFVPREFVNLGVSWGYEEYTALQASRTATNPVGSGQTIDETVLANPALEFNDPRRDWTADSTDIVRTFTASADILKGIPKTEVRVGYDLSRGKTTWVYGLAPNTAITIAPEQFAPIKNELHRATADVRYFLTSRVAVGMAYIFDKYLVEDFALGDLGGLALPASNPAIMMMGYTYRPYTAHTTWARLTYYW